MAVTIQAVPPGTPAASAGLAAGMEIVSINGHPVDDGLDYEFYSADAALDILVRQDGAERLVRVQKDEYQPLGCQFASYLIDRQHACKNRCVFCFVDQLPKGLRPSLYFKDDDERLGFLFGNYITLTNLDEREIQRIIDMRFSPVNISVHTADPDLRVQMMGNKHAGQALQAIPRLAEAGISMNFQLVLCPGLNDGPQLEKSIDWLAGFWPAAQSIAAVPVGLTRHRQGLPQLRAYTAEEAARQLDIMLAAGDRLAAKTGLRLVYPSDEWFLLAGRPLPGADFYDGYPQLENGVGMWRSFYDEFLDELAYCEAGTPVQADVVSGTLAAPLMETLAAALRQKHPKARLHVHAIQNDFFGPGVTVTGLLTGQDMAAQLKDRLETGLLLLPADVLRAAANAENPGAADCGDLTLDGWTPAQLAAELGCEVRVVPGGAAGLVQTLLGC